MNDTQKNILAIDDDADIRHLITLLLKRNNYNVTSLPYADKELSDLNPDLVILDMWLTNKDGRDICKVIKTSNRLKHIPVIMMSAHINARELCLDAGADYFIDKPFDLNSMLQLIKKAFAN